MRVMRGGAYRPVSPSRSTPPNIHIHTHTYTHQRPADAAGAGGAGRGLLDHPRRRPPALHPHDRQPHDGCVRCTMIDV